MTVERFRGKYLPFSNMYPPTEWIETDLGIIVPTSEHAYMANQFADPAVHALVAGARGLESDGRFWKDGAAAKVVARRYTEQGAALAYCEDSERIEIMRQVIRQKLARNTEILMLLLGTGHEDIYEGNDWSDTLWGVSPVGAHDSGQNHLGRVYMELRTESGAKSS